MGNICTQPDNWYRYTEYTACCVEDFVPNICSNPVRVQDPYNLTSSEMSQLDCNQYNTVYYSKNVESCHETAFCSTYCYPSIYDSYSWYSTEPMFHYINKLKLFTIDYNNIITYIPYIFTLGNKWGYINNDYNLLTYNRINSYISIEDGIGYCTNIENKTKIKFIAPFYAIYSINISIFTTLISHKLIHSEYTVDQTIYNQRLKIYSTYIIKCYVLFYKKINNIIDDNEDINNLINNKLFGTQHPTIQTIQKYIIEIFNNFYTNTSDFSYFLRKLDCNILFIYNIIKKNADEQNIEVNDLFLSNFYNLIFDNYIMNLNMTTELINIYFSNIVPEILSLNYNNVLNNWLNFISKSYNMPFILAAKYAPLYINYEKLNENDYTEEVMTYVNLNKIQQNFNFYVNNALPYQRQTIKVIGQMSDDDKNIMYHDIINHINTKNSLSKKKNNQTKNKNIEKKCNCKDH